MVDVRNADGYYDLKFYSSSPVTDVEIVGFNSQLDATAAGVNFIYPGEGSRIPGVFFVDKNNQRKEVSANNPNGDSGGNDKVEVEFDHSVTNGGIRLISTNPINVTKRYITLKVTSADGLVKYVVVEQYPLEYIQPIAGYYSYRDDFKSSGVTPNGAPCHWEMVFNTAGNSTRDDEMPTTNGYFTSKIYTNGSCYYYEFVKEWFGNRYNAERGRNSNNSNNMMYFVTLTQTNTDYKIAHPLTEERADWDNQTVIVSSEENDKLVSPAFMLASQLGAVLSAQISGWTEARKHCAYYVETYQGKNGQTVVLDDWRLPTSEEIKVIIKYQDDPNADDVMDNVLGGQYYYVGWQGANNGNGNALVNPNNNEGTFIRCIRDVKPTDEFMKSNN